MKHLSRIIPAIVFTSILMCDGFGQPNRYNENWMFGNYAGISFNGFNTGAITGSAMSSPEGVASISDNGTGLLKYYTNGQKVWGFDHLIIQDGDLLMGDANSTQSALLVPYPQSGRFTFLFTTAAEGGQAGLKYSLIDKNLGSNGGIVPGKKNIGLATPVAEKLSLLRHCDHQSFWVVGHEWGSNRFFSWHITHDGLDPVPVETYTGPVYSGATENSIGYMKPSPNDDLLALAVTGENRVDLFYYDNATGAPDYWFSIDSLFQPYGIEFSADQSMLYVSCLTGAIYQYSLMAPNIEASRMLVGSTNKLTGALQMAPDGRIYIARDLDYFLGYIGSPNSPAYNCNYVEQGVHLSGRLSEAGLPPYIPSLDVHTLPHFSVCLGDTVAFNPQFLQEADSFIFYFGEPSSVPYDTSTVLPAWHLYHTFDHHTVKLIYWMCGSEYLIYAMVCTQGPPGIYLGEDTAICSNISYYLPGMLNSVYCSALQTSFLWNTGQTTQSITIAPPGQFVLTVSNICGTGTDTVNITALPVPTITIGPDMELCTGDTAVVFAHPVPDSLIWSDGSGDSVRYFPTSGYYIATAINEYHCMASDDIHIEFLDPPSVAWEMKDTTICLGHPMELDAGAGFDSYLWQDGSGSQTFLVADSGWYHVSVMNMCGTDSDSMHVTLEDCSLKLYVPNAFTPDADGLNDVFKAYGMYIEDFRMTLFNRWGEAIFFTGDIEKGWDGYFMGKPAPEGTYAWKVIYLDATGKYHHVSGTFILVR